MSEPSDAVIAWTDGATYLTNPGWAGHGGVIRFPEGVIEWAIPMQNRATSNQAEYAGLLKALTTFATYLLTEDDTVKHLHIHTDSTLLVLQFKKRWWRKQWAVHLQDPWEQCRKNLRLIRKVGGKVTIHHIPREENAFADKLSKEAAWLSGQTVR